jgi:class 3 adenylate cyclase/tetratricopeptide (TPR) repeat protein
LRTAEASVAQLSIDDNYNGRGIYKGPSMDLGGWLQSLGLGKYEPIFIANAIDSDVLPALTESDLEKLGVIMGDRKRLIKAIGAMVANSPGSFGAREVGEDTKKAQVAAERRHLTVMICDLVGSTALSARLDPEDMGGILDAYQATCARIVLNYDGFLSEFRGDGIIAYFGYPRAHEDDAERTVRAGLDIVAAIAGLETRAGEALSVRIGIATGLVVVGDLGGEGMLREHAVVGDAPNLAARLQAMVEPGTVVVAESTRRLLGDLFRLRDLGRREAKGFHEAVGAWAVEGISASESRFEAIRPSALTDLIGRDDEIGILQECQRIAWKGEGQIVLISGEAGIGKSRIAAALAERIADKPYTLLRYQCSPYHIDSALRPIIEQLERSARFKSSDTSEQRLNKLETVLAMGTSQVRDTAPLIAGLLSIPFGDRYPPLALSPAQQRRRTHAALLDQMENLARKKPILIVFEDVHWADATSLELIDLAVERVRQLPVLALFTFRSEFEPPWAGLTNVRSLLLRRLDRNNVETMIARMTGGRSLPAEIIKEIVTKTDGNPLFVTELTKAVLEAGILRQDADRYTLDGALPSLAIPATLQDSLMARLDRLTSVKEISQIASVIGREFSYPLLRAIAGREESSLKHALTELDRAELVYCQGEPPESVYSFKHSLVRDAAYESLLKSRRQQLHGQIARVLEHGLVDNVASQPEIVAHHFTEAGLVDPAIDYWLKAGNLALSHSANAEAVKHLRKGIELARSQAPSPKRIRTELDLFLALGPAVAATAGYAAPETLKVFSHARDLLGNDGTLTEQMTVLWGTYLAHSMRAEHLAALDVAQQCLGLAANSNHPGIAALANRFMGQTLYFLGSFSDARPYLEKTLDLCAANPEMIPAYRQFGTDDQVMAQSFLASTLLLLGYPEQSAAAAEGAVARARTMGRAFTTSLALSHVAFLGALGCDPQRAEAYADEALAQSVEHGLANPEQRASFCQGALLAQRGDPERGIELMRKAMAAADSNSARYRWTEFIGHIASAHASLGQPEAGLILLDEAIQTAETTSESFFEAELYRLRGNTLLILGRRDEGEAELHRALTISQQRQARWWELRAAVSLAKHLQAKGEYHEAYSVLQPVYSWFVEGFDRPDLKEAVALLDGLRQSSVLQTQTRVS